MKTTREKLRADSGISVWIVLLLVGVLALLAIIAAPTAKRYRERANETACEVAVGEARYRVENAATLNGGLSDEEAKNAAMQDLKSWDELCPSGGDCYVLLDENGGYQVVCALHTKDLALKTRLNASHALEELKEGLKAELLLRGAVPDKLTLTLNSRELVASRVDEEPTIKRGTRSTPGYEGTVALYRTDGDQVVFLCYADEDHCAIWRADEGWSGDCFA